MGLRRYWLVVVAGCGFDHGTLVEHDAPVVDDGAIDATSDASSTTPDAAIDAPMTASCSTAGLTCVGTVAAVVCNGACWVKCTGTAPVANQAAADLACTSWGGKLAPLRTAADHQCVAVMLFPSQAHWIGLEQANTATSVSGGWSGNGDGVALSFTGWGGGQPNDANGNENGAEQCAMMNTNAEWHDLPCDDGGLYRFSCRR